MKKLAYILAALLALGSFGAVEVISVPGGAGVAPIVGGRLANVLVASTVADGTLALKSVATVYTNAEEVVDVYATNVTYSLVYSNGTEVVTNTTPVDYSPFPAGMRYLSYATNTAVTHVSSTTNAYAAVALVTTNDLASVTCSDHSGQAAPEGVYVVPGDRIFYTGTALGRVLLFIER